MPGSKSCPGWDAPIGRNPRLWITRAARLGSTHSAVMELRSFELRDPARLMKEVAERVSLTEDSAYAALVHHPSTNQTLLDVVAMPLPALLDDDDEISDELREVAESFGIEWRHPIEHLLMTIVVRPGFTVLGPNERVWLSGWRYANHFQGMFTGDVIVVTEHGWLNFMTNEAGRSPHMHTA